MALYLGSNKVQININNVKYSMRLFSETFIANGIRLLSSDGYILQDSNGIYLTAKEDN